MLEVVPRLFDFILLIDVAVGEPGSPHQVIHVLDALQVHGESLDTVGDLTSDRLAVESADLLKVGELGDFHAVQPDFPAQSPGAERGVFPVVFDQAYVVRLGIDAERFERTEVEIDDVGRRRLQHHLELVVVLQAVRILAVTAVLWPARGLYVGGTPRLRTDRAQKRRCVRSASADFHVVGLQDCAAAFAPIAGQRQNHVLERRHR